jgi:hypothetical protein
MASAQSFQASVVFVMRRHLSVLEVYLNLLIHPIVNILAAEAGNDTHQTEGYGDVCDKPILVLVSSLNIRKHETEVNILDTTPNDFLLRNTNGGNDGCIVRRGEICST